MFSSLSLLMEPVPSKTSLSRTWIHGQGRVLILLRVGLYAYGRNKVAPPRLRCLYFVQLILTAPLLWFITSPCFYVLRNLSLRDNGFFSSTNLFLSFILTDTNSYSLLSKFTSILNTLVSLIIYDKFRLGKDILN